MSTSPWRYLSAKSDRLIRHPDDKGIIYVSSESTLNLRNLVTGHLETLEPHLHVCRRGERKHTL